MNTDKHSYNKPYSVSIFINIMGAILSLALLLTTSSSLARDYGQYGPFDYYDPQDAPKNALYLVQSAHFGPKTKDLLRQGKWCGYWSDVDYTLRAFPNHPDALLAMAQFLEKHEACPSSKKKRRKKSSVYDIMDEIDQGGWKERKPEFYFDKALEFRPNYSETHILYGKYLHKSGQLDKALEQFTEAVKLDPKSADAHYYLGLIYLEKGASDKAAFHAEKYYGLGEVGQKTPDLKEKLISAGIWNKK